MAGDKTAPFSQRMDGAHVLIVGGGSGIGFAVAQAVVANGGRVTISSRNADKLAAAAGKLGGASAAAVLPFDMTDESAVSAAFSQLADGGVDHLVITASSAAHGRFDTLATEPVRGMFEAKFFGPYVTAREALPKLKDGGSITLFSGVLSRKPGMNCSGLGAVNSAVEGLTRALALELGPRLRVNCCAPGMVRSEAYDKLPEDKRETMYAETGRSLPVGRVGIVEEVADAVLYLMHNTYTTGIVMDVDGGHMVRQYA